MTGPRRVTWSRTDALAGRKLPPGTKLVTRASRWGNPYPICPHRTRQEAVEAFALLLATRYDDLARNCPCMLEIGLPCRLPVDYPPDLEIRAELGGWNLACACAVEPCHASVLLVVANSQQPASRLLLARWQPDGSPDPTKPRESTGEFGRESGASGRGAL